jgi:hypothetical protein
MPDEVIDEVITKPAQHGGARVLPLFSFRHTFCSR